MAEFTRLEDYAGYDIDIFNGRQLYVFGMVVGTEAVAVLEGQPNKQMPHEQLVNWLMVEHNSFDSSEIAFGLMVANDAGLLEIDNWSVPRTVRIPDVKLTEG